MSKKYITKPIDYTGCNSVIAEHLKRGEAIKCRVWDSENKYVGYVVRFAGDRRYPYITENNAFGYAEPITITTETRVKKASEIVKWLEDNEWKIMRDGSWNKMDSGKIFNAEMFFFCGKEPPKTWTWHPDWFDVVEIEE